MFDRWAQRHPAAARRVFPADHQGADVGEQAVQERADGRRPARRPRQHQGAAAACGGRARPHRAVRAAKPLIAGVGSADKEEVVLKGGHVSLVAGPQRGQAAVAEAGHMAGRDRHERERVPIRAHVKTDAGDDRIALMMTRRTRRPCWPSRRSCRRTTCCSCGATSASPRCCQPGWRRRARRHHQPAGGEGAVPWSAAPPWCATRCRGRATWAKCARWCRWSVRGHGVGQKLTQESFALALEMRAGEAGRPR